MLRLLNTNNNNDDDDDNNNNSRIVNQKALLKYSTLQDIVDLIDGILHVFHCI